MRDQVNADQFGSASLVADSAKQQSSTQRVDPRSDDTRLLTSREVADRLCMSHEWLRKKVQRREIPFVRLGRYVRFTERNVVDIIEAAAQPASPTRGRSSARTRL